jgi:hypothetical protein
MKGTDLMERIEEMLTDNGDDPHLYGLDDGSEPASPSMRIHHASKMIRPTILQCNQGGFIIMIPGHGVAAKSNFEDAMAFLADYVHKECYGQGRSMPKVVRDMWQGVAETVHSVAGWLAILGGVGLIGTVGAFLS